MRIIFSIIITGLALLQVIWLSSCNKGGSSEGCEPYSEKFYYLTDFEKTRCPYTGDENLLFVSNKGDSVLMKGQSKRVTYYIEHFGSPDCPGRDDKYENISFNFLSDSELIQQFEVILNKRSQNAASGLIIKLNNKTIGYSPSFRFIDSSGYTLYNLNGKQVLAIDISQTINPDSTYYNHSQGLIRYVPNDTLSWNIYKQ